MDFVASPTASEAAESVKIPATAEIKAGLTSPHKIRDVSVTHPNSTADRPPLLKHVSSPTYASPLRRHQRHTSAHRQVKESLDAHSEYITSQDDGVAEHRINQYVIKQEIGRGSFGAVHLAVDQYGTEYAVKEFSKSRLRKRAQSHILRKPPSQRQRGQLAAKQEFNSPMHRNAGGNASTGEGTTSAIELIKEELAIMKKLDHPNLVSLIEVLDDPREDSLYMVMELCKKGVVMKIGLDQRADPYPDEKCREWFGDLILGIEYLHAQGVVHRDIKPDNCLVTAEDVLKVVDFGVSEMFEKDSEMMTAKSAGSPAFLPPELCVAKHGDISGKAADIWSMGVTLYCMKYGRIPFEKTGIFELYESIKTQELQMDGERDEDFRDLMSCVLEKDPHKRIKMSALREHPWVTRRGEDPMISESENISDLVEPPTEAEVNAAITGNMRNLMTVLKAVNKFKSLTAHRRPPIMDSILGEHGSNSHFSRPPGAMQKSAVPVPRLSRKSQSYDAFDRQGREGALVVEGVHQKLDLSQMQSKGDNDAGGSGYPKRVDSEPTDGHPGMPSGQNGHADDALSRLDTNTAPEEYPPFRSQRTHAKTVDDSGHRGHAHDPLQDHLYLFIGPSTFAEPGSGDNRRASFVPDEDDVPVVSESPGAADVDVYETAYRDEIERIRARTTVEDQEPVVFLNRRVDAKLMASGRASRWTGMDEEQIDQIKDWAKFRETKAKVNEVSRALREVARAEYARRRQERKDVTEVGRTGESTIQDFAMPNLKSESRPTLTSTRSQRPGPEDSQPSQKLKKPGVGWSGLGSDKGKQARSSFKGLLDMMKGKGKDDEQAE